jgi:predicted nucleic-acid-binding Zn-ribbon protein
MLLIRIGDGKNNKQKKQRTATLKAMRKVVKVRRKKIWFIHARDCGLSPFSHSRPHGLAASQLAGFPATKAKVIY